MRRILIFCLVAILFAVGCGIKTRFCNECKKQKGVGKAKVSMSYWGGFKGVKYELFLCDDCAKKMHMDIKGLVENRIEQQ